MCNASHEVGKLQVRYMKTKNDLSYCDVCANPWENVLTQSFVTEKFPLLIKIFYTYALFKEYFFFFATSEELNKPKCILC